MPMRYNDVLEWDHIVPVALGGSHDPANMRVVHKACNRKAGGSLGGHRKAAKWQLMEAELRRLRGY
jgi:hypothetical protein